MGKSGVATFDINGLIHAVVKARFSEGAVLVVYHLENDPADTEVLKKTFKCENSDLSAGSSIDDEWIFLPVGKTEKDIEATAKKILKACRGSIGRMFGEFYLDGSHHSSMGSYR